MVRGELFGGRFRIERSVSRSTSMQVYRALDESDSSAVMVRIFPTLSSAGALHLERVCSALWQHPHFAIEPIVTWGRSPSGAGHTVSRVPDGPTLEEANSDGMRDADLEHVARRTLEALTHLHDLGVVHGGVSAEAVVLPRGVAGDSMLTETTLVPAGLILGESSQPSVRVEHARHLAPEQVRGISGATPSSDIFALGCTLYHALGGALPFAGSTPMGSYLRTLYVEPKPLLSHGQSRREALELLARRMMTKDAALRPTAREALVALAAVAGPSAPSEPRVAEPGRMRVALIVCRLLRAKAQSLESEADVDRAEQLLRSVNGRLDRLERDHLLVEIAPDGTGDIIDRAGRAALILQTVLPLSAIVLAEATIGSPSDLDRIDGMLDAVRSGQISIQPELIPRLGQRFQVELDGRESASNRPQALMWELEPETHPRPSSPRFDSEVTLSESGQITMEISVPETWSSPGGPLEPLPTAEMDLGPLAQTTRRKDDR